MIAGTLAVVPGSARSQSALTTEGRIGAAVPVGSFRVGPGGGDLGAAPALGLQFALRRGARTWFYVGFAQARLDCSVDGCPRTWVATQWNAGVRFEATTARVAPWVRAGIVTPSVENVPVAGPGGGDRPGTSERGWGGEAGAGVRIGLTERFSLSPGARYVFVDVGRAGRDPLEMRYVVADLGVVVGF